MEKQLENAPKEKRKLLNRKTIGWGFLLLLSLAIQIMSRRIPGFGEWYAVHIYPVLVNVSARIFSPIPFSVSEMLFFGGIAAVLIWLVWLVVRFVRWINWLRKSTVEVIEGKTISLHLFCKGLGVIAKVLIAAFFLYTVNCGVNYQRTPFSVKTGFDMSGASDAEVLFLCLDLTKEVNDAAAALDEGAGEPDRSTQKNVTAQYLAKEGRRAMLSVAEVYPDLKGYYPNAKPITNSWFLSYQELTGIYLPFTIEANYNRDMVDMTKPFTVCHELSHLRGFMREDEANFIAYLACRASDDPYFRYSGALNAYQYATNVLFRLNKDVYWQVRKMLCKRAEKDFEEYREFWKPFEDGTAAKAQEKINDTYLRVNSQYDGVKSYGRMVDLLIALMRQEDAAGETAK